jgi:putative membrane protein
MYHILGKLLLVMLGIALSAHVISGVFVEGIYTTLIVALVLGILNILVRPILFVLTLPITILTLGLFSFVINAGILLFISSFVEGFSIDGFLPAVLMATIVALVNFIGSKIF